MAEFSIPKSATRLERVSDQDLDLRPESEILAELKAFQPITSEKNIWAFWNTGLDTIYPSYRHTIINWVRKLGPSGWTVRVVDMMPSSPNYLYEFVSPSYFPSCMVDGSMEGRHAAQEMSDLLRLPLLYEHGGCWLDVGNMLHTHLDTLWWDQLSDSGNPFEMGGWLISGQIRKGWGSFGNFMLPARKGCIFIRNWHETYKTLWEGHTSTKGFHKMPLMKDVYGGLATGMEDYFPADKLKYMSDYVAQMMIGERTRNLLDIETGWNGRDFFAEKVFMVEGIRNGILGALETGLDGYKQAEYFTTRLDEPDEEKRLAAEAFVVKMLEESHMYKVYHNSGGDLPALGDVIKMEGYKDACHRPGTFGELYRYGTVHWRSTRQVERIMPQKADEDMIRATVTKPSS